MYKNRHDAHFDTKFPRRIHGSGAEVLIPALEAMCMYVFKKI